MQLSFQRSEKTRMDLRGPIFEISSLLEFALPLPEHHPRYLRGIPCYACSGVMLIGAHPDDSNPGLLRIRKECHSRSPVTGHPAQSTKITCGRTCNESEWNHGRIAGQRSRGRWTCVKRALRVWLCKVKSSHLTSQHLRAYAGRDLLWVGVAPGLYNSQPQTLPGVGQDDGCCDLYTTRITPSPSLTPPQ